MRAEPIARAGTTPSFGHSWPTTVIPIVKTRKKVPINSTMYLRTEPPHPPDVGRRLNTHASDLHGETCDGRGDENSTAPFALTTAKTGFPSVIQAFLVSHGLKVT